VDSLLIAHLNFNMEYEYFTKRGVCYKRGLDRVNYGQTGRARTDASTGEGYCWFMPDGEDKPAIKLNLTHVFFDEEGYFNGTESK